MSEPLRITVPARKRLMPSEWIAAPCAFVCFVAAGHMFATRTAELYDMLDVELPRIQDFTARHSLALAVAFLVLGTLLLAATRVRGPRARLAEGVAIAAALGAVSIFLLWEWIGAILPRHGQCLCQ